jgi:hypothetical protein
VRVQRTRGRLLGDIYQPNQPAQSNPCLPHFAERLVQHISATARHPHPVLLDVRLEPINIGGLALRKVEQRGVSARPLVTRRQLRTDRLYTLDGGHLRLSVGSSVSIPFPRSDLPSGLAGARGSLATLPLPGDCLS